MIYTTDSSSINDSTMEIPGLITILKGLKQTQTTCIMYLQAPSFNFHNISNPWCSYVTLQPPVTHRMQVLECHTLHQLMHLMSCSLIISVCSCTYYLCPKGIKPKAFRSKQRFGEILAMAHFFTRKPLSTQWGSLLMIYQPLLSVVDGMGCGRKYSVFVYSITREFSLPTTQIFLSLWIPHFAQNVKVQN